jgi:hypothetical protein
MKIIPIFGPENSANEGLWSLELDGTLLNEFEGTFNFWQDAEEVYSFCSDNMDDIRNPKLRIYAVRIAENTYVVTGGAIKLTDRMEERPHTKEQLVRLAKVKDWLRDEGILYPDDLIDLS